MLSERSHTLKIIYCTIALIRNPRKGKTDLQLPETGSGGRETTAKECMETFWGDWNTLLHDCDNTLMCIHTLVKMHHCIPLKLVNFILCKLCLNKADPWGKNNQLSCWDPPHHPPHVHKAITSTISKWQYHRLIFFVFCSLSWFSMLNKNYFYNQENTTKITNKPGTLFYMTNESNKPGI